MCSGRNAEMVLSIGADDVIDYTKSDFRENRDTYDLILDNVGNQSIIRTTRALKPQGIYVTIAGSILAFFLWPLIRAMVSGKEGRKIKSKITDMNATDMAYLGELLASGKVVPVIDRTYSLSEVPDAIRYLEKGHARGKVVIDVQR